MKMQDETYQKLKETAWRRPLKPTEEAALQAFLKEHPESRQAWAQEASLNLLLGGPSVPAVSSNFTARLLEAVQRPAPRATWRGWLAADQWFPHGWISRAAMASLMLGLGLFSFHEYEGVHRIRVAREVADASRLASLPPIGWLRDFDTINRLNQVKAPDDELLAALK